MRGSGPIRTCIGCRQRDRKSNLKRIVVETNGTIRPDPAARLLGRGAWLHGAAECLDRGLEPRHLGRAFRRRVDAATEEARAVLMATRSVAM